jgi:6-methylsalicylic acid synthase
MDSILTVMVRRRLEKRFGCRLPSTLLWHTPTVAAIAAHVAELLNTSGAEASR